MSNETKINALIELIKEDRIEIREIRNRMYSTMQWFVVASLAITAYGLGTECAAGKFKLDPAYLIAADIILLAISWVYFYLTRNDLKMVRKCLQKREKKLTKDFGYNYFPNCNDVDPEIKDNELFIVIGVASVIFIALIIAMFII